MKFDILIYIGRFQPFHFGHMSVVTTALDLAEKVFILVGSANRARSIRNPWTFKEREFMIKNSLSKGDSVEIFPIEDSPYNDTLWLSNVRKIILEHLPGNSKYNTLHGFEDFKIGLIGCNKDATSYYLKMFPGWESVEVKYTGENATDIREGIFRPYRTKFYLPDGTYTFFKTFFGSQEQKKLTEEYNYIKKYKNAWKNSPYSPIFVTGDAVVIQAGHILLVTRKASPGKGLYALPGGFINQYENIQDGVIRELKEETKIKLPTPVLKGSLITNKVFDYPYRSDRGRIITHAYLFHLNNDELPKVKGGSDANRAIWTPISNLKADSLFEDHYDIIYTMLGLL